MPKTIQKGKSLAEVNPKLAKEWHKQKNGTLTPFQVTPGSSKKVWWKCSKGDDHEWLSSVAHRSNGRGCPMCSGRKVVRSNCLEQVAPELAKQWYYEKNENLKPSQVTASSNKKVWWKCPKGDDHEWQSSINGRNGKASCPFCTGHRVSVSTSIYTKNPDLVSEWHPTKNANLTPRDVSPGSNKKVWWKCPKGEDHEWQAPVARRVNGSGCPFCSNRKLSKTNNLEKTNPSLFSQWHPTKNGSLDPTKQIAGGTKKVWWKCPKGEDHEWQAEIGARVSGSGCPYCSGHKIVKSTSLSSKRPDLILEWDFVKNTSISPEEVNPFSHTKVWWKCRKHKEHEWYAKVSDRSSGRGCPFCANRRISISNSLSVKAPELAKQWHPTKNGDLTPDELIFGSNKKVWWKCPKGDDHEWQASMNSRQNSKGEKLFTGCPICAGKLVVQSNSLKHVAPELAKQWHPTKNKITPDQIALNSNKRIWWKCPKGDDHEWQAPVQNRAIGRGCPVCSGHKAVVSNSLGTKNKKIAKEWHPTKNGKITVFDVTPGSNKKVWWKCPKGEDHEWISSVVNRVRDRGCPYCTLTPQSKQELTITFELKQFFEINPKGFKTRISGKLMSLDIYISSLNLGIEFDGSYWHKGKRELDKLKTQKLNDDGFQIMRIREEPLLPITPIDVVSKKPFNAKKVTNEILKHILDAYELSSETSDAVKSYLRKRTLQNEEGLNEYIEKILEEKAQRKSAKRK